MLHKLSQRFCALTNSLQTLNSYLLVLSLRLVDDTGGVVAAGRVLLDQKAREAEGDFGASRIYVTGIPMGPLDTDREVIDCIRRRLQNNAIQFDTDSINLTAQITGRIPREIINFSAGVYNRAAEKGLKLADIVVLNDTFLSSNGTLVLEARDLCTAVSRSTRMALGGLLAFHESASAEEVAHHLYPSLPEESLQHLTMGIKGDLDRVCSLSTTFCIKTEDRYEVPSPVNAYALSVLTEIS